MPNRRPPNSFHHENALFSDLFINETHKLRTQHHGSAWHSRNERLTQHISAQAELSPQESEDNSTKQGGKKKTALSLFHLKNQKKTNLHRSRVPAYTLNFHTCSYKRTGPILVRALTTHTSQTGYIWYDNLYPASATEHMDRR